MVTLLPSYPQNRRKWRELLYTAPGLGQVREETTDHNTHATGL